MKTLRESFLNYFRTRKQLNLSDGWIGQSTSSDVLQPLYISIKELSESIKIVCRQLGVNWTVKFSLGHGRATPDQYISVLPPGQAVSDGIYFCICFDRTGTGCVMGAMTSISNKQVSKELLVQRGEMTSKNKSSAWFLYPPNQVNIFDKNNGFYNPTELLYSQIKDTKFDMQGCFVRHFLNSQKKINDLLKIKETEHSVTLPKPYENPVVTDNRLSNDCPNYLKSDESFVAKTGTRVIHRTLGKGTVTSAGQYGIFYVQFDSGVGKNFFPRSFEDGSIRIDSDQDK